jgi:hypothetical protein
MNILWLRRSLEAEGVGDMRIALQAPLNIALIWFLEIKFLFPSLRLEKYTVLVVTRVRGRPPFKGHRVTSLLSPNFPQFCNC